MLFSACSLTSMDLGVFHGHADERMDISSWGFVDLDLMELAGWMDSIEARSPCSSRKGGSVRQSPYCATSA